MNRHLNLCGAALCLMAVSTLATAADPTRFFVRGGPAYANFDASARVSVDGTEVPGGDASVHSNTGAAIELGYVAHPNWHVTFAMGVPPNARISGAGTLGAAGKLGEARYAPAVIALLYVPEPDRVFSPYIGVGLNYTWIYHVRGSALSDLKVDNAGGVALQFGAEFKLGERSAWFVDAKKIWLKTDASGRIAGPGGPQLARARVTLDPLILSTGLSFHF
jgi:outer membrane protein